MSYQGPYSSGQKASSKGHSPGQLSKGGKRGVPGPPNRGMEMPQNSYHGGPSETGLLATPAPLFAAANPPMVAQPSNTLPYQFTVVVNAPAQAPASHYVPQPVQPQVNTMHPHHHTQQVNPYDAPPPYTPHAEIPPPSANLHGHQPSSTPAQDFDKLGKLDSQRFKQEFQGRGRGTRMRGNFSKSCGNLNSSHQYRVANEQKNDSAYSIPQGKGRGNFKRGSNFPNRGGNKSRDEYSHNNYNKAVNDSDDNDSEKSFSENQYDRDGSHQKRGRGGRGRGGFRNWKGKTRGNHRRGDGPNFARKDLDEDDKESSGEYDDDDNSVKSWSGSDFQHGRSGHQRGKGGGYHDRKGKRETHDGAQSWGKPGKSAPKNFYDKDSDVHKRGNTHQEDHQRKQAKPKVSSTKQSSEVQELCVTLHFKMDFKNATVLKNHIETALVFPKTADFELSFDEFRLQHAKNEAYCKFTICSKNPDLAKNCVKNMITTLIGELKTFIKFDFEESDSCDLGSSEKLSSCPSDNFFPHDSKLKSADMKADKDAKKQMWKNKTKQKLQVRAGECEREANDSKTTPLPIPTTVDLTVEDSFSSETGFKTFLRNAASALPFEFEIVDASVILSDETSKCCIHTQSKADARKMTNFFHQLQKQTHLSITCTTYKTDAGQTSKKNAVKVKLDLTKSALALRKTELLQNHEDKISHLKTDLLERSLKTPSKKMETDCIALRDRFSLAEKQKEVFLAFYRALYTKLENLDSSSKIEDITRLQTLFEIECDRLISALPVYAYRDDILQQVKSNQVSIIVGENGCGKSTQIAQYLFDAGYASEGVIVCTQPEHLSTVTLAEKVAKELSVKVGSLVGYKSSLGKKANSKTKILFATDHCFLNEYIDDPGFEKYSCIIVDEAHKHSVYTDLLLGMLKCCISQRTSDALKVIIISSPTDSGIFVKYFKTCQQLPICCRHFDVNTSFNFTTEDTSDDFENYEEKAVVKAHEIHIGEGEGNILIFLSSSVETLRCCQEFEQRCKGDNSFKCMPLHSQLPPEELKKIFIPLPKGQRKIIFATKIAETSFTVEGVKYVIDSGMTSETKFDAEQKLNLTKTCPISQRSASLRKNCAGLSVDGKCYYLYSKISLACLAMACIPDILRVHLEKAILKVYELGIKLRSFEFVHEPSGVALNYTMETLKKYGAIFNDQITEAGQWISKLPLDPMLGFLIYEANKKNLLYDAVVLAAIISLGSDFSFRSFSETDNEVEVRNRKYFGFEKMDCFAWLGIYKTLSTMPKENKAHWCRERSINYKSINSVRQCVEEVKAILSENFNITICNEFSDRESALITLKKLHLKSKCPHFATL